MIRLGRIEASGGVTSSLASALRAMAGQACRVGADGFRITNLEKRSLWQGYWRIQADVYRFPEPPLVPIGADILSAARADTLSGGRRVEGIWHCNRSGWTWDSGAEDEGKEPDGSWYRFAILPDAEGEADYNVVVLDTNVPGWRRGHLKGVLYATDSADGFRCRWTTDSFRPVWVHLELSEPDPEGAGRRSGLTLLHEKNGRRLMSAEMVPLNRDSFWCYKPGGLLEVASESDTMCFGPEVFGGDLTPYMNGLYGTVLPMTSPCPTGTPPTRKRNDRCDCVVGYLAPYVATGGGLNDWVASFSYPVSVDVPAGSFEAIAVVFGPEYLVLGHGRNMAPSDDDLLTHLEGNATSSSMQFLIVPGIGVVKAGLGMWGEVELVRYGLGSPGGEQPAPGPE